MCDELAHLKSKQMTHAESGYDRKAAKRSKNPYLQNDETKRSSYRGDKFWQTGFSYNQKFIIRAKNLKLHALMQ